MLGSQQKVIGFFLLILLVITIDQGFKYCAPFIWDTTRNNGVAFGFFESQSFYLVLIGLAGLSLILMKNSLSSGSAFLLGGAVSNLIDRLRFGYVFDYIDINGLVLGKVHFPVFNLADVAIVFGAVLLIKEMLSKRRIGY